MLIAPPGESTAHSHLHHHCQRAVSPGAAALALLQALVILTPLADSRNGRESGGRLTSAALSARDISKRFGSHQALDGVSIEVLPGSCVVVWEPAAVNDTPTSDCRTRTGHR